MYDPVGAVYERIGGPLANEAARECVLFSLLAALSEPAVAQAARGDLDDQAALLRGLNGRIVTELRTLFARHPRLILLRCSRRVRYDWISQFLAHAFQRDVDAESLSQVAGEFPLLATNVAFEDGVPASSDAASAPDPQSVLFDGLKVALLSALHRMHAYLLNTTVREAISDGAVALDLVKSYVRRGITMSRRGLPSSPSAT